MCKGTYNFFFILSNRLQGDQRIFVPEKIVNFNIFSNLFNQYKLWCLPGYTTKFHINPIVRTNFTAFLVTWLISLDHADLHGNNVDFSFPERHHCYQICHKTSCMCPNCTIFCVSMVNRSGNLQTKS